MGHSFGRRIRLTARKGDPMGKSNTKAHVAPVAGLPAGASPGSTSKKNNRTGSLSKRMHGAGGSKGYPK